MWMPCIWCWAIYLRQRFDRYKKGATARHNAELGNCMKRVYLAALMALIAGCSTFRGPPGPKMYDSITVVHTTDKTLLAPGIDQEFMRVFRARMTDYTEREIAAKGDLKLVNQCGPRTLQVSVDFIGINIDTKISKSLFRPLGSGMQSDNTRVTFNTVIRDCTSKRILSDDTNTTDDEDTFKVLKEIAHWSIRDTYKFQHGKL